MTRARDLANISPGVPTGFRNGIINGGMDVWQRSTSSTTNGAYNSVDRWWMYYNAGTATFSRESSVVPVGFQYALKVAQASATASMVIYQVIETANAVKFAGKTVTLSVYLASSAAITINPDVSYTTSTDTAVGGSWTNITATPASWSIPSGSTYARYTATLTIPSTAKSIRVGFGPASIAAGTSYYIAGVQFEEGSVATPFEHRPIGTELALCQRYYERFNAGGVYSIYGIGLGGAVDNVGLTVPFSVTKRVTPTSFSVGGNIVISDNSTSTVIYVLQLWTTSSPFAGGLLAITPSSLVAGKGYFLVSNNDSTSFIAFSSEL